MAVSPLLRMAPCLQVKPGSVGDPWDAQSSSSHPSMCCPPGLGGSPQPPHSIPTLEQALLQHILLLLLPFLPSFFQFPFLKPEEPHYRSGQGARNESLPHRSPTAPHLHPDLPCRTGQRDRPQTWAGLIWPPWPCSHSFFLLDFSGAVPSFSGSRWSWFSVRKRTCRTSCSMRQM